MKLVKTRRLAAFAGLLCATFVAAAACWDQQQVLIGETPPGDSDTDVDSAGSSDTPTDSEETWQDCGYLDGPCCEYPDYCAPHLANVSTPGCHCYNGCEPTYCESALGGLYSCIPHHSDFGSGFCSFPDDKEPVDCDHLTQPNTCTTPSGDTGGFCMFKIDRTYCVSPCEIALDECDDTHHCSPLTNGSGACVPGNWGSGS